MRDVTPLFASFREAARHLWNTTFHRAEFVPAIDWDRRDDFSRVLTELFAAVVLTPLGANDDMFPSLADGAPEPLKRFIVQPNVSTGVPIAINRGAPRTGYWDDPVNRIAPDDARMEFVRFFDWDELGMRDFKFVEIQIRHSSKHPSLAGRYALLEFGYAQILFDDAAAAAAAD